MNERAIHTMVLRALAEFPKWFVKKIPEWTEEIVRAYVGWLWRTDWFTKTSMFVVHVIAIVLVTASLPLSVSSQKETEQLAVLGATAFWAVSMTFGRRVH